jgi:hypothetical protein
MNYRFGKNICAKLVKTGGAAGERLITDEFSTDLDEMDIFVISKDQTFRICATFPDPAKFSILVIHLFKVFFTIPQFVFVFVFVESPRKLEWRNSFMFQL